MLADAFWMSTWPNVVGGVIAAIILGVMVWAWKHLRAELEPNGGSSFRDAIDRVEADQGKIKDTLDDLVAMFHEHIGEHRGRDYNAAD